MTTTTTATPQRRKKLPQTLNDYVKAVNNREVGTFESLFTKDAVVHDEGRDYRGASAIKWWLMSTVVKYSFTIEPADFSVNGPETVLTVKISGGFSGSPITTPYRFVLREGKIAMLNTGK
jgi:SnoaL-like domain